MDTSTRWWIHHCLLQCQAHKTSRQTLRWPTLSLPLPKGLSMTVSIDCFGPLPTTPHGNIYILVFADRFSRRVDLYAAHTDQFTAKGTADIFVDLYISVWAARSHLYPIAAGSSALSLLKPPTNARGPSRVPSAPFTLNPRRCRALQPHHGSATTHLRKSAPKTTGTLRFPTPPPLQHLHQRR